MSYGPIRETWARLTTSPDPCVLARPNKQPPTGTSAASTSSRRVGRIGNSPRRETGASRSLRWTLTTCDRSIGGEPQCVGDHRGYQVLAGARRAGEESPGAEEADAGAEELITTLEKGYHGLPLRVRPGSTLHRPRRPADNPDLPTLGDAVAPRVSWLQVWATLLVARFTKAVPNLRLAVGLEGPGVVIEGPPQPSMYHLILKQAWSHHVSKSKRINPHRHVRARRVGALVDSGNSR